jgi:DNA polymerase-3 subunit epsilon
MDFLDDQPVVVVDVETTGLAAAYGDRICEIGIVRAQGEAILDTFQTLVNPQRPISPGAQRVNGIRDAQVASAPIFAAIADQVLMRIDGAMLVCHNAPFDLGFLEAEFSRLRLPWQPNGVIDTLDIARSHFHFGSNSLAVVARRLGIETPQAHRALGDALTTFQIFRRLRSLLAGQGEEEIGVYRAIRVEVDELPLPPEIQDALANNQPITITYIDAKDDETIRTITPLRVHAFAGSVHLVAFCHLRQAERNFRLDRIVAIERVD